jgi:hypothetical protein
MENTLPTLEEIEGLIKLHPHLDGLLGSSAEVAEFVAERLIRRCSGCSCWCAEEDFEETVSWLDGPETETRNECRWCREDLQ